MATTDWVEIIQKKKKYKHLVLPGDAPRQNFSAVDDPGRRRNIPERLGQGPRNGLGNDLDEVELVFVALENVVEGPVVPVGEIQTVGVATELVDVKSLPLKAGETREKAAKDSRNLKNKDDTKSRLVVASLLDLVQDGVADALHQAVGGVRTDNTLDDQDLALVGAAAIEKVVDLFRELLLGGDLLKRDQVNHALALVQLPTNCRFTPFGQKPRERGDLHQDGLVSVALDDLGKTLLSEAVKDLGNFSLLVVVEVSLRQSVEKSSLKRVITLKLSNMLYCLIFIS